METFAAIMNTPIWDNIRCNLMLSGKGGNKFNINISTNNMTQEFIENLLNYTMPCVSCGDLIHPVRCRKASRTEDHRSTSGLYLSSTCRVEVKPGCSRKAVATFDRNLIVRHLDPDGRLLFRVKCPYCNKSIVTVAYYHHEMCYICAREFIVDVSVLTKGLDLVENGLIRGDWDDDLDGIEGYNAVS